jgi:hypothetical protein
MHPDMENYMNDGRSSTDPMLEAAPTFDGFGRSSALADPAAGASGAT